MKKQSMLAVKYLIILMLLLASFLTASQVQAKRKWIVVKKISKIKASHYTPQSNTPAGSRNTSSGKKARPNHTIAVDYRHRVAKMGQKIRIRWKHKSKHRKKVVIYTVEDYGGFWKYGRHVDVFTLVSGQGIQEGNAEIVRKETKKEYKKRLQKEEREREQARKLRQKGWFKLVYDKDLLPNQVITDPNFIKGGDICFGGQWFEVIKTKRGLGNKILVGMQVADYFDMEVKLEIVEEGAVG